MSSAEIEFWDSRYRVGRMPWDFQGVPAALLQWLAKRGQPGRVLIPGCGSAYEVRAFTERGWEVLAVDFSPFAVQRAREQLGALPDRVLLADFFQHDFGTGKFDVVYERTFLCSLPRDLWPSYAQRVANVLTQSGTLIGFFFYGVEDEPPPFPLSQQLAESLFGPGFDLIENQPVADSLPLYAGHERWQVWQKK